MFVSSVLRLLGGGLEASASRGRPTKLTAQMRDAIVARVLEGTPLDVAAAASGVHRSTLFEWLRRSRDAWRLVEAGEVVPASEESYAEFADAVRTARAQAESSAVSVVRQAMSTDYRAATWYLTHSHSERWSSNVSPTAQLDIVEDDDEAGRVQVDAVKDYLAGLDPRERARVIWAATVADDSTVAVGEELDLGRRLHRDALDRLAISAATAGPDESAEDDSDAVAEPEEDVD